MTNTQLVKKLQIALNAKGENLVVDGIPGPKTTAAANKYDIIITANKKVIVTVPTSPTTRKRPSWLAYALGFKGKHETDPEHSKFMVGHWKFLGLDLKTIATSWAAWCGLAVAVALMGVGADYQKNGAAAKNWAQYGVAVNWKVDGIPEGAIVHINHVKCGNGASNHVAFANGDCTASDLLKSGATFDLYGGNQGNSWKVSTYRASTICAVRWPKDVKDYPKPGKIAKSINCTSKKSTNESTTFLAPRRFSRAA